MTNQPAPAGKPEPLDIPDCLKAPAGERKAAWKGRKATKVEADKEAKGDLKLPRSIEPAGRELLKEQQQAKKETKEARLRALRESKAAAKPAKKSAGRKLAEKVGKEVAAERATNQGTPLPADPKKREAAVDKLARKEVPAKKKTGAKSTKLDAIAVLLKKGCTTADILKATGWPSVSVPACARQLGVELIKDKKPGEVTRYRVK